MVTVHIGPRQPITEPGLVADVYGAFWGRASMLFVLVAGVGVALLARGRPASEVATRLVYRAVWLLPLGLFLQDGLDHPVAVILQYYALYFVALIPFVSRSDRVVLAWAAALVPIGSTLLVGGHVLAPEWFVRTGGSSPIGPLGDLLLFGYYPLVTWLSPMLFGLWLGRRSLADRRMQWALLLAGVAVFVLTVWAARVLQQLGGTSPTRGAWSWFLSVDGHAGSPPAIVSALAFAAALLGMCLLVTDRFPRVTWPLAASGQLALSVYVGHLVVFHVAPDLLAVTDVADGVRTTLAFGMVTATAATAWLRFAPRGPLEALVRWPWVRAGGDTRRAGRRSRRARALRTLLPPSAAARLDLQSAAAAVTVLEDDTMSSVTEHLESQGVQFEVLAHDKTPTARDEARALGLDAHDVVKTVVLDIRTGHAFAVVPADCQIDVEMVGKALNSHHVKLATEEEIARDYPEFELGAIPPLGALVHTPLVVDTSVLASEYIVFASGTQSESIRLRTSDLFATTNYTVAPICTT